MKQSGSQQQPYDRARNPQYPAAERHRKLRLQHQHNRHRNPVRASPVESPPQHVSCSDRKRQPQRMPECRRTEIQICMQRCDAAAESQPERLLLFPLFKFRRPFWRSMIRQVDRGSQLSGRARPSGIACLASLRRKMPYASPCHVAPGSDTSERLPESLCPLRGRSVCR